MSEFEIISSAGASAPSMDPRFFRLLFGLFRRRARFRASMLSCGLLLVFVNVSEAQDPLVYPPSEDSSVLVYSGPIAELAASTGPSTTDPSLVVGLGAGSVLRFGSVPGAAASFRGDLGLGLGPLGFDLRAQLSPDGLELPRNGGGAQASLYVLGAGFSYLFRSDRTVRPVVGVGLEYVILDPDDESASTAFAAAARTGLEFAFPLHGSEIVFGMDGEAHIPFAAADSSTETFGPMLTLNAYTRLRF